MSVTKNKVFLAAALGVAFLIILSGVWLWTNKRNTSTNTPPASQGAKQENIPLQQPPPSKTIGTNESQKDISDETNKEYNPSKNLAFYFTSDYSEAFIPGDPNDQYDRSEKPFDICFNGDTVYFVSDTEKSNPPYRIAIQANIFDNISNQRHALTSVKGLGAANGCVRVARWTDETHLLSKSCGGDLSSGCSYVLLDVEKDRAEDLGSYWSGGVWDEGGYPIENRIKGFIFSQHCSDQNKCESINIFRDLPEKATFPYSEFTPIQSIPTTKEMKAVDFEELANLSSFDKKVTIHVGDGFFVFDLQKGIFIESKSL